MPVVLQNDVILTASKVQEWLERRSQLTSELAELDRKIEAAAVLGYTPKTTLEPDGDETMPQMALKILAGAGKTITNQDLMKSLKAIPRFEERLTRNPNSFYNMMGRLARHKRIVRDGKKVRIANSNEASE